MRKNPLCRRLTALVLIVCLIGCVFSGCGTKPSETTPATVPVTDPTVPTTMPDRAESHTPALDLDQNLTQAQRLAALPNRAPGPGQAKMNTVMVYMVGSDLESNYGAASSDIQEMLNAGLNPENTNLVIYTGGARGWDMDISSSYNSVFSLDATGRNLTLVGTTEQAVNTGDPAALADFLWFAYESFPAMNYDLILWDHGGGPLYGFGSDELFEYDSLPLWELDTALASSPFAEIDLGYIGFDACLMGSIETAAVLAPYARYLVASEEVEDGNGWDYSFLQVYNDVVVPANVAREILATYEASMQRLRYKPEYTLSCMNLSYVSTTLYHMSRLFEQMSEEVLSGGYHTIAKYRDQTKRFAMSAVPSLSSSYDLVDLGSLATMLSSVYSREATSLMGVLEDLILEHVSNVPDTYGVSVYFPYDNRDLYLGGGSDLAHYYLDCEGYINFLDSFGTQWSTGRTDNRWKGNRTTHIQTPGAEEEFIYLQIDPEALDTLSSAAYSILQYNPETDTYYEILMDCQVTPDADGMVAVPKDPRVFLLSTDISRSLGDLGESFPVPAVQISDDGRTQNYICNRAVLMTSTAVIVGQTTPIRIVFNLDAATGQAQIMSILNRNEDADFFGKRDVDVTPYNMVGFQMYGLYPTYDSDGSLYPAADWQPDSLISIAYQDFREEIRMETANISSLEGDFFCQLTLKDTFGNVIAGDLVPLKQNEAYRLHQISTPAGELSFAVYADHAEVLRLDNSAIDEYSPEARTALEIPAQVEGVSVTVIRPNAFKSCHNLSQVVIPGSVITIDYDAFNYCSNLTEVVFSEGLERIGSRAFSFANLTSVNLPNSLKVLDSQAFSGNEMTSVTVGPQVEFLGSSVFSHCVNLKSINVDRANTNYRSIDGVLYNADGSILLCYPGAKGTSYRVPEGTVEIGAEAFISNRLLTDITFPETLKVIDSQAFCNVVTLGAIDLPDSLEFIGAAAFGREIGVDPGTNVRTIVIGPNVRWIGEDAFSGYLMDEFKVDSRNAHYSSVNGCLLNASGTKLINVPLNHQGLLEIPQGVSYILWGSLEDCDGITELVFPDSVSSISQSAGLPRNLQKLTVGSGLCSWNGIEDYAAIPEIILSPDNPFYTMKDGCIYNADGTELLLCLVREGSLTIPEGVTTIYPSAFGNSGDLGITQVHIPASLVNIPTNLFGNLTQLQSFTVAPGNPVVAAWDGLLYTANGQTLVACPLGITGTVSVRPGTRVIGANAFTQGYALQASEIILPEGVSIIRSGNLYGSNYYVTLKLHLPASLTDIYPDMLRFVDPGDMEIHAPAGSFAANFAASLGLEVLPE